VIRSIDGPIVLTACFTEHGMCSHTDKCSVREPLRKVHEGILQLLSNISIADMSHDENAATQQAPAPEKLYGLLGTRPSTM
jgi:DNA-binding IscR family transcriptional regulator